MSITPHAFHTGVVGLGLVLVAYLLAPGRRVRRGERSHDRRVAELRHAAAAGELPALAARAVTGSLHGDASPARAAGAGGTAGRTALAVACLLAAGVHAAVCPEHFAEATRLGLFFAGLAAAQVALAVAAARPGRAPVRCCVMLNGAAVLLWAVTRTTGLPFGLAAREPVGAADLVAVGAEVIAVAVALAVAAAPAPGRA